MSRSSRFDKLESDRSERPKAGDDPALERRFGSESSPSGVQPADTATTDPLTRFETDGAEHLAIETGALARLPFRRCPECLRDSSKFDTVCIFCREPLDTAAAQALNLELLATAETERANADAARTAAHQAEIKALVDQAFERHRQAEAATQFRLSMKVRGGLFAGTVGCWLVALWARSFCPSIALFTIGLALLVVALPQQALAALAAPARRRFHWWR